MPIMNIAKATQNTKFTNIFSCMELGDSCIEYLSRELDFTHIKWRCHYYAGCSAEMMAGMYQHIMKKLKQIMNAGK